jgi:hypothetical protein
MSFIAARVNALGDKKLGAFKKDGAEPVFFCCRSKYPAVPELLKRFQAL